MLLRMTKGFFKIGGWLVLGMLVIVAVYLLLGRLATFLVEANQHQIERYLRDNGLEFVELGTIKGDWRGHDPRFIVKDISVKPLGEPALDIDSLVLRLDSVRSFMAGVPIVIEMELSGVRFAVERNGEEFWIKGFERGRSFDFDYLLDSLPHLELLKVDGIDVALIEPNMEIRLVSHWDQPWVVSAEGDVKRVSFPLFLEKNQPDGTVLGHRVRLSGHYQGDFRKSDFVSRLYLDVPQIDLGNFTSAFELAGRRLSTARLGAKIWLTLEPDNLDVTGEIALTGISLQGESSNLLDAATSRFRFHGASTGQGTLSIPNVSLKQGEFEFKLDNINLATETGPLGSSLAGQLDHVDVSELTQLIEFAGQKQLLPERLSNVLLSVSPVGELKDLLFTSDPGEGAPHLVSSLMDFSIEAYLGTPSIDHLNGFVSLHPDRGYLDIDNDRFKMYFENTFDSAWSFDAGRGRLSYSIAEDSISVTSGLIELLSGDIAAYGKLSVNLPPAKDFQTWGLTIGIANVDLLAANDYIPNAIPEDLRSWIVSAVKGGRSNETGLTVHGALFSGSPAARKAHDVYLKVENTTLEYHPDWPPANDLKATIHVANHHVVSNNATGRMYSSDIEGVDVFVAIPSSGRADTVLVEARLNGPFEDALRALKETPLAAATSNMAAGWSVEGKMQATLAIEVPIGIRGEEEVRPDVLVNIEDALLQMPDFDLDVLQLSGDIRYNNDSGLSSHGFSGVTFGRGIRGRISSQLYGEGGEIVVHVDGSVDVPVLYEWSDQFMLSRASGVLDYAAEIHVPYGGVMDRVYVEAFSDLTGVIVDLPEPLAKPDSDSVHDFSYRQTFNEPGYRVDLSMDDNISASLKIENGIATGGRVHFGKGNYGAVSFDAIRVSGNLPFLNFGAWEAVINDFGQISDVSLEDEIRTRVSSAELNIDEFLLYHLSLDNTEMLVTRGDDHWIARLHGEMLNGEVKVFDGDAPLGVNLKWLSLDSDTDAIDPLNDVDPTEVADVDFSTGQLLLDGKDFGSWAFKYRTSEDGGRFEDFAVVAIGVQVVPGALGEWQFKNGRHKSRFTGDVLIDDLAEAQHKLGYASSIEGKGFKLTADLSWDGSPAMLDVERVSGELGILKGSGRFVQAETGGALKLLGIFDFASLAQRFRLDFSDVINKGFEFTDIQGVMSFDEGAVDVQESIVIHGSSSKFTVGGSMDLVGGTLDNDMIVTLPVERALPWYAAYSAIATGPSAGASVMIAQKIFKNQINQLSSAKYKIGGTVEEPDIKFVTIFDNKVREAPPSNP